MANNQNVSTPKSLVIKIVIIIIIIAVLVTLWFVKNADVEKGADNNIDSGSITETKDINPDFALNVTEALDLEKLKSYGVPIIIDFGSDSCIPCKEMAPVLEKLNAELQGKAIIRFVDVWKYPDLAQDYPLSVIPTQMLFDKDGNPYTPSDPQASGMTLYTSQDTNEHIFTTHEGGMTEDMMRGVLAEMGLEE
ncbi:thioredoxin family protein [Sinanaerobacter chloroacetimidivorans]|uniref:Thioredoxin family protein n=1 Tax=Sinanaerobacter chloroacetimidivorans TaxID=2818044 RepID=A0A8J8B3Q4_9FIRM|nr:thioredoxin family protein [Sinanaerobacter chloroacetimidivorans]MBR0598555.1 thioredoxin family protein [Sinanaerobacter chloroacetimidivorans]